MNIYFNQITRYCYRAHVIEPLNIIELIRAGKIPYAIIKIPLKDISKIKAMMDELKPASIQIKYEPLKWYQGWFPRYSYKQEVFQC